MSNLTASTHTIMSSQNLYSSVTSFIKQYFINSFPPNFFKYVYMRNSNAFVTEQRLSNENRLTKPKPALAIGVASDRADATFTGDAFHFGRSDVRQEAYSLKGIYDNLFRDDSRQSYVSTFRTRTKLLLEVGIKVESEMKAFSVENYMRSNIVYNRPFYINNAYLETPLPNSVIKEILVASGMAITTPTEIALFNEYLNLKSFGSITYKKNNSTGNFMYFYKFSTNILCTVSDKPSISKNMKNKSISDAILNFAFEVEFGNHLNFITEHRVLNVQPPLTLPLVDDSENTFIINYTFQMNLVPSFGNLSISNTLKFVTDEVNASIDTLNFKESLNKDIIFVTEYVKSQELPLNSLALEEFTKVLLYRDGILIPELDYTIDWNTYELTFTNPYVNYEYTLVFYFDFRKINSIIEADTKLTEGFVKTVPITN